MPHRNQTELFESRLNKFMRIREKGFSTGNGMIMGDYK